MLLLSLLSSGYPGAFTPTCSDQVPSYISNYDAFAAKVRRLRSLFARPLYKLHVALHALLSRTGSDSGRAGGRTASPSRGGITVD